MATKGAGDGPRSFVWICTIPALHNQGPVGGSVSFVEPLAEAGIFPWELECHVALENE